MGYMETLHIPIQADGPPMISLFRICENQLIRTILQASCRRLVSSISTSKMFGIDRPSSAARAIRLHMQVVTKQCRQPVLWRLGYGPNLLVSLCHRTESALSAGVNSG